MKTRLKAQEPAKTDKRTIDTQLLKLCSACQNNADELLKESRLLLTHGHHARAYFLAYTAREELCKAQVVADSPSTTGNLFDGVSGKVSFWGRKVSFRDPQEGVHHRRHRHGGLCEEHAWG